VTGTGWNGNKVVTAVTATTVTFARGTITANGTTSASSFANATASLSTSFRNIFQVLYTANISSVTESGSTVTVTTTDPHNFTVGQTVTVTGVSVAGYNGPFTVASVIDSTHFTYTAGSTNLANGTGGTASTPVTVVFTIPTGGGTYNTTTGVGTNVTTLVIRFLATGNLTVSFLNADPLGNKLGLADGNYFLNTTATLVTDAQGKQLDGDRDGNFGGNGHDEFYRLFGDVNGDRVVNGLDNVTFAAANGTSSGNANYQWYLDVDLSGVIDSTDATAFHNHLGRRLIG
jgi:hypothetical protein